MKTVIVEDEYVAAQSLQRLLEATEGNIEVINILQSVEESIEWFSMNPAPDLVFMDIHLADGHSFSIFDQVNIECPIIFTTAYDEYALNAFEVNSIDYLLKPITKKKLDKAFLKLKKFSKTENEAESISNKLESISKEKMIGYKSHFLIPYKDKLIPLPVDKIAYIFSEFKMAKIYTLDGHSYVLDVSLDEISRQLNPSSFFRINRQYIVSHKAITDISFWFGRKLSVNLVLPTPDKIVVSRARIAEFKNWYTMNFS
jgi:two-component system LytT family response regulator